MVITEIQNKQEAKSFINNLNSFKEPNLTDRSYAVHLLFLVSGLEIESANLILGALSEIDKVTGPYIACHIFIDRIEVPIYETLLGIYERKPIENSKLSIKQIEGICTKGKINHVEMDELKGNDLTSANELIARELSIVDKVPCVVIFDSVEVVSSGTFTIMSFPKDRKDLSEMLRGILGILNKGKFEANTLVLEKIHELFDKRKKLKSKIGAPINHKKKVFAKVLKNLSTNLSLANLEINRVCKKLGIKPDLSEQQIHSLCQSSFVHSDNRHSNLSDNDINEMLLKLKNDFNKVLSLKKLNDNYQNRIDYLRDIREKVIQNILTKIEKEDIVLQTSLEKINIEISNQINKLKQGPSIVKSIKKNKFLEESTTSMKATLIDTVKSGIKELGKPSFWIKLFLA